MPSTGVAQGTQPQPVPGGYVKTWHNTMGVSGAPLSMDMAEAYHGLFAVDGIP